MELTATGYWVGFLVYLWDSRIISLSDTKSSNPLPSMTLHRRVREVHSKVVKLTINDLLNAKPANGW